MVQLSAAGLGVPTNNLGNGLASALREGTQGFMAGTQMRLQQERAAREQAAYEQALKKSIFELGQEQSQAQAQEQAGSLIGQVGNAQGDANVIGPPTEQGLLPANAATHKQDFQQLQQHHADVMKQAGAIAGKLPPQYQQQFWNDIKQGMQQDAMNLQRVHTTDSLHDGVMKGWFDAVDPTTGERVPNEAMRQQFADLADRVKAGEIDPLQAQQMADQVVQKINQEEGAVKQRLMIAEQAGQQLQQNPAIASAEALGMVGALRTGQIDVQSWQKVAPYVLSGMVPNPRGTGWLTPQDAAMERQAMQAETQQRQAGASQAEANAEYTRSVKPVIEQGKLDLGAQKVEAQRGMNLDKIKSQEKIAAEKNETAKGIAAQKIQAEIAKSATQAGYSDEKAYHQAVADANLEFKNGTIEDVEAYKTRLDELYQKYKPKESKDQTGLIDSIIQEHPDWTKDQIKAEVKKRGG